MKFSYKASKSRVMMIAAAGAVMVLVVGANPALAGPVAGVASGDGTYDFNAHGTSGVPPFCGQFDPDPVTGYSLDYTSSNYTGRYTVSAHNNPLLSRTYLGPTKVTMKATETFWGNPIDDYNDPSCGFGPADADSAPVNIVESVVTGSSGSISLRCVWTSGAWDRHSGFNYTTTLTGGTCTITDTAPNPDLVIVHNNVTEVRKGAFTECEAAGPPQWCNSREVATASAA